MKKIKAFIDGSYFQNSSLGGWGFIVFCENKNFIFSKKGFSKKTDSARMELLAFYRLLEFIEHLKEAGCNFSIEIYTDSKYVLFVFENIKKNKNIRKNKDLISKIKEKIDRQVEIKKVDSKKNRADKIAYEAVWLGKNNLLKPDPLGKK